MSIEEATERLKRLKEIGGWTGVNDYYREALEAILEYLTDNLTI